MILKVRRVASMQGNIRPPSDKSLTHRAYMFGAIADGPSVVEMPLKGEDCQATLHCLSQMGLKYDWHDPHTIELKPAAEWISPEQDLYCGNSGTTIRLMSGLIASRPIDATLTGDDSLSRRPMGRIADPLRKMGAEIQGDTPPLTIHGDQLRGITHISPVASAQIKSGVLLAGLRANGYTTVIEPSMSRDHTERMMFALNVNLFQEITENDHRVSVQGGQAVEPFRFSVPADISSAAFFLVAAAIVPQARLRLHEVGINPTRTGIFDVLSQVGIPFFLEGERFELGEPVSDIEVSAGDVLQPFTIEGALIPKLIDEVPILAVLATQCDGTSVIRDAKELRVKESDRIEAIATGLRAMGAEVETFSDGMAISGPVRLKGAKIEANGDHRIAMAFTIAGLIADGETEISGAESIATSYPEFESDLWSVCVV